MKKLFYTIVASVLVVPFFVNAQLTRPTDTHGLSGTTDADLLVRNAIDFVTKIIASLAVLMIVVSGILYITSGGDQQRTEMAKKWLIFSIVGLVVALLAYVIVIFVGQMMGLGW
jgi:fumarate reductase subunit D